MTECPECHLKVPEGETSCPQCGGLLLSGDQPLQLAEVDEESAPQATTSRRTIGLVAVAITLVTSGLIAYNFLGRSTVTPSSDAVDAPAAPGKVEAPPAAPEADSDALERDAASRASLLQDCYERERKHKRNLAGKIEVELTIGEDGTVTQARTTASRPNFKAVAACIVSKTREWQFAKPQAGSTTIKVPFVFGPTPAQKSPGRRGEKPAPSANPDSH